MPQVLLCAPQFFDVVYSINPWMQGGTVDRPGAMRQWDKLKQAIKEWGVKIKLIDQQPEFPDMVFTANAGTLWQNKIVLSNFRFKERQGETEFFEEWFNREGYLTYRIPNNIPFEGCGDTVMHQGKMLAGYGHRSTLGGVRRAAKILGVDLIPLKLRHPNFYHLDTCFCLLGSYCAMYYPGAFTPSAIKKLKKIIPDLIPLDVTDATQFACNSVVYGDKVLMPSGPQKIVQELHLRGYSVTQINTSEFLKSGGSLQCMTLWI